MKNNFASLVSHLVRTFSLETNVLNGSRYSRMDQVKLMEDGL